MIVTGEHSFLPIFHALAFSAFRHAATRKLLFYTKMQFHDIANKSTDIGMSSEIEPFHFFGRKSRNE